MGACKGRHGQNCPRCCFHRCFELWDPEQSKAAGGGSEGFAAYEPSVPLLGRVFVGRAQPKTAPQPHIPSSSPACQSWDSHSPWQEPPGSWSHWWAHAAVRAVVQQFHLTVFDTYLSLKLCVFRNTPTLTILPPEEEQAEGSQRLQGLSGCD